MTEPGILLVDRSEPTRGLAPWEGALMLWKTTCPDYQVAGWSLHFERCPDHSGPSEGSPPFTVLTAGELVACSLGVPTPCKCDWSLETGFLTSWLSMDFCWSNLCLYHICSTEEH